MNRTMPLPETIRWWPSAVAGGAAAVVAAGVLAVSAAAEPSPATAGRHQPADTSASAGCPSPPRHISWPFTMPEPKGCEAIDRWWQYIEVPGGHPGRQNCPPPPDLTVVAAPWVPPQPTGCRSLDEWWEVVDPQGRAGGAS